MCVCMCILWDFISYSITLSVNRDNLIFSFQGWMVFISFSCLISLLIILITMVNKSGELDILVLFLIFQSFTVDYDSRVGCGFPWWLS